MMTSVILLKGSKVHIVEMQACPKLYLRALITSVKSHLFLFSKQLQFSLKRCRYVTGN